MTSNGDDLEKVLQQNLKLRRELGAEVAKARDSRAIQRPDPPAPDGPAKLTTTEARQGTGPREMFWVLVGSIALAVIGGLALGVVYGWIPLAWSVMPLK